MVTTYTGLGIYGLWFALYFTNILKMCVIIDMVKVSLEICLFSFCVRSHQCEYNTLI